MLSQVVYKTIVSVLFEIVPEPISGNLTEMRHLSLELS